MRPFFARVRARRIRRVTVGSGLAAAALVCACGARGPLDIIVVEQSPAADASLDAKAVEAGFEAADGPSEAARDVFEAEAPEASMGFDAGPLGNCGACLVNSCGTQLLTCITAPACTTALQCVATSCLTGGMPDLGCLGNCTKGNATTEMQLLSVIGCVIGTCGTNCAGVLGGLGGLGGGGGGGGGG